jgi:hypothetical protein
LIWPDAVLWRHEVGFRAALHTQTRSRDLRWFKNIWEFGRTPYVPVGPIQPAEYDPFRENADVRRFEAR